MSAYELLDWQAGPTTDTVIDEGENYGHEGDAHSYASDTLVTGSANTPPLVSDKPVSGSPSLQQLLGSTGDVARSVTQTARDLGTAIGTVKRAISNSGTEYQSAQRNAATGNVLGQWWQYASTQDKIVVLLAVAGVGVGIWQIAKS